MPDVSVLAVEDQFAQPIRVHVEQRVDQRPCAECGTGTWVKERPIIELVEGDRSGAPAFAQHDSHLVVEVDVAHPEASLLGQA